MKQTSCEILKRKDKKQKEPNAELGLQMLWIYILKSNILNKIHAHDFQKQTDICKKELVCYKKLRTY